MKSELQCVMTTRGCETCTPHIKPYKFNSLKLCKQESQKRGYDKNHVLVLNIQS